MCLNDTDALTLQVNVTVLLFRLSDLITFKQKPLYQSYILSKYFFLPLHDSFSLVLKHRNSVHFEILIYNSTHVLAVNVDWVSPLPVVGAFLFWLVIFFSLVLSLKLQIELSGIHWSRKVSYLKSRVSHWTEEKQRRWRYKRVRVPSNTLLLIPNEFGTEFEKLETLEELEIEYLQPERETISHGYYKLFAFLYSCNPLCIET